MTDKINILIVDDEPNSTMLLKKVLVKRGYHVEEENNSLTALKKIEENFYDIIISDLQMPDKSGMDLLKAKPDDSVFIMITGYGSVDSAVLSMKSGAYDYINKPFNLEEFTIKVDKAAEKIKLKNQLKKLREQIVNDPAFFSMIGRSKKILNVFDLIKKYSNSNANVLIEGESGTGKELVSRAIHLNSSRKNFPFVAINCSAIPENLLENELFGHTKGAYTGAVESQKGVFEEANNGTLLLDEIAEMPYILQSKLLRVLENFEIKPIGSDKIKRVNVRVLSATNQNLKELVNQKKFREDLFYRISTVCIYIPSLDERKEDIPLLAEHFLKKYSVQYGRDFFITAEALDLLIRHNWKGNVRELENALERAAISSDGEKLDVHSFKFLKPADERDIPLTSIENLNLKQIEKFYIKKTLEEHDWNKTQVAKVLGIDRKTLYKKISEYNLE
jgi:DNA-binding NtrC family response regulator